MLQFLVNETSNRQNYINQQADFLLYAAAQESLDRTIRALGVDVVQQRASEIRHLQDLAKTACKDMALYPCTSAEGEYQIEKSRTNCYIQDYGCGYPCVDQGIKDYNVLETNH
jgi:recombinational DNA repair ATPase RecF